MGDVVNVASIIGKNWTDNEKRAICANVMMRYLRQPPMDVAEYLGLSCAQLAELLSTVLDMSLIKTRRDKVIVYLHENYEKPDGRREYKRALTSMSARVENIKRAIEREYHVQFEQIASRSKHAIVVQARGVFCYIMSRKLKYSFSMISTQIHRIKGHSTAITSAKRTECCPNLKAEADEIYSRVMAEMDLTT